MGNCPNCNNSEKKIAVIGSGPGSLTAAMLLSHKGYSVSVFEKKAHHRRKNRKYKTRRLHFRYWSDISNDERPP